jgi:hypothetical protein
MVETESKPSQAGSRVKPEAALSNRSFLLLVSCFLALALLVFLRDRNSGSIKPQQEHAPSSFTAVTSGPGSLYQN